MFSFVRSRQTAFWRGCTISHSHQPRMRVPAAPHARQHLPLLVFWILDILIMCSGISLFYFLMFSKNSLPVPDFLKCNVQRHNKKIRTQNHLFSRCLNRNKSTFPIFIYGTFYALYYMPTGESLGYNGKSCGLGKGDQVWTLLCWVDNLGPCV